jgi:hypothetical protein
MDTSTVDPFRRRPSGEGMPDAAVPFDALQITPAQAVELLEALLMTSARTRSLATLRRLRETSLFARSRTFRALVNEISDSMRLTAGERFLA